MANRNRHIDCGNYPILGHAQSVGIKYYLDFLGVRFFQNRGKAGKKYCRFQKSYTPVLLGFTLFKFTRFILCTRVSIGCDSLSDRLGRSSDGFACQGRF